MVGASGDYFDELETHDPALRERRLFDLLPQQIRLAKEKAEGVAKLLRDVTPSDITSYAALARLPVIRKSELIERQRQALPFGGLNATPVKELARIYASPGPIYDAEGRGPDYWRMARALYAAGVREGELVHNCFAYHFTPAGMMIETGAEALGCPVFPGGVGNTELQVKAIADLRPAVYAGTPSFLRVIVDKAKEMGADISSLKKAVVGGEALPASLRGQLAGHGISVLQLYGTADLGLVAYESPAREGMILDEWLIVEIVRPGTGDPVAEGEVGEIVVTTLNPDYPLIRFATGDLSAFLAGQSPCGRTNRRIKGWMGRADQTTKVKGMFVHPAQVAELLRRHPNITKARLVVDRLQQADVMTLHCECAQPDSDLAAAISQSIEAVCKLKGEVMLVVPGSLANDGKVIDDVRKLD
ncbi:MAG: AMP-binding protein [Proteobacteria bacterium]|nr:AMP-binding protein [Pseudomonadota bacterium]MBI3499574.1 AMP-binding protein [Pseudomonadota bacterium]